MIRDVDKLNEDDLLVVALTAKEAHLVTAFPLALYHLQHPTTPQDDIQQHGLHYTEVKMHALYLVSQSIKDGTMERLMEKLGRAMEVAVYLKRQK